MKAAKTAVASIPLVVIAGGLGTRLKTVLPPGMPKILAAVGGRPFIDLLIDHLYASGIRRIVFALGYGSSKVVAHIRNARWPKDLRFDWAAEARPAGTAGALTHVLPLVGRASFLVTNGDSISDTNPVSLIAFHRRHGALATLAVSRVRDTRRFGTVVCNRNGAVTAFREKSTTGTGLVNCGFYAMEQEALGSISKDKAVSLERDLFPSLIGRGLYAARVATQFMDIGTRSSLHAAQKFLS